MPDTLTLYIPRVEDLGFYQKLLADPATMAFNAPWFPPDGCIPFPEEEWADWHARWVGQEPERFYAYLRQESDGAFVGDVNFHRTPERGWWDMGIRVCASERGKGYGRQGLALLLDRAFRVDGIACLHNDFEDTRGAALHLHRALGFRELGQEDGIVHLLLTKEDYDQEKHTGGRHMNESDLRARLTAGNRRWQQTGETVDTLRRETARKGQKPYAIVIACSDSRVIPEQLFDAGLGELFVIRVAGNVLDRHQLGSIEYAAAHLHCRMILLLGHTSCGAVSAALSGGGDGFIRYITDEILLAVGEERDPLRACEANVRRGLDVLRREFAAHPEIPSAELEICGAVYDIESGAVRWLD